MPPARYANAPTDVFRKYINRRQEFTSFLARIFEIYQKSINPNASPCPRYKALNYRDLVLCWFADNLAPNCRRRKGV